MENEAKKGSTPSRRERAEQLMGVVDSATMAPNTVMGAVIMFGAQSPQMSNWLAPEERDQLCFAFEAELKRLKLAA
jgi:hypothetical protein